MRVDVKAEVWITLEFDDDTYTKEEAMKMVEEANEISDLLDDKTVNFMNFCGAHSCEEDTADFKIVAPRGNYCSIFIDDEFNNKEDSLYTKSKKYNL